LKIIGLSPGQPDRNRDPRSTHDFARATNYAQSLRASPLQGGYHRYWLAVHHNIPGIETAAAAVVIGHVTAGEPRTSE
jgi:alkanesulfonate monooxygenase SsuD/methylene tetrahydromethanopterin reductase-like flavin-dependent oxidoreductase (luciferase family)